MLSCDLCKNTLIKKGKIVPHVALEKTGNHICDDCIAWCKRILKDPNEKEKKIIYLNEYKEMVLSGK